MMVTIQYADGKEREVSVHAADGHRPLSVVMVEDVSVFQLHGKRREFHLHSFQDGSFKYIEPASEDRQ